MADLNSYINIGANTGNFIGEVSTTGTVVASSFTGDGSGLSNIGAVQIAHGSSNITIPVADSYIYLNINGQDAGHLSNSVSLGLQAGQTSQGVDGIAIGTAAGQGSQGSETVAIGKTAGNDTQGQQAIAIGSQAGVTQQGITAVGIGYNAAYIHQGQSAIAIGYHAGYSTQGQDSIAIGTLAGETNQASSSIILNASGSALDGSNSGFYVNPVRNDTGNTTNAVYFNTTTKELTYGPVASGSYGNSNVVANLAALGSNPVSTTGNVTAGNISTTGNIVAGNLSVTGNVVGNIAFTGGNIILNNTTGAGGSDEGGELHFAAATANSTLSGPIAIDIYQSKMRFFETQGNTFGMYVDIANTAMGVAGSSLGTPAIGYRDVPQISLSANVTANVTNAGKHFYSTTAGNITLTIPDNANVAFPTGATLTIVMNAAGNVVVAQGTGVSLYLAGSSTTGNRVVGAYGLASVMKVATNTWVISGTGVY